VRRVAACALDGLCQVAVEREDDHELRAEVIRRWDALSAAERQRLRHEADATFAQWRRGIGNRTLVRVRFRAVVERASAPPRLDGLTPVMPGYFSLYERNNKD
jgi:hypothetical protein